VGGQQSAESASQSVIAGTIERLAKNHDFSPDNSFKTNTDSMGTRLRSPEWKRRFHMPTSKELTIRMEDQPEILGRCCKTLAARGVNILAFQAVPSEGNSVVRMVVDNPATAKEALDREHLSYTESEIAQASLTNRPGELARAATQLGEANINIEHAYSGLDAKNSPVVFFAVKDISKAVAVLDKIAKAA
jgi:hypothetical protein